MLKQSRAYRCLLALVVSALGTGGCAPASMATAAPKSSSGPVQFMVWGDADLLQAYQSLVARYEQRQPGQRVELVSTPNASDYQKRLAGDFAAGTPADVILLSYLNLARFASRRLLAPVAPFLASSNVVHLGDFYGEALRPFVFQRQIECLPQNVSGLVVYYNKKLFQQAGLPEPRPNWTWDDFVAAARRLTRVQNGDGQPDQFAVGVDPTLPNLAPFIWQNQGSIVDDDFMPGELAFDTPAVLSATTWLVSLQMQYHVAPDAQAELAEPSQQRFLDGTLAMLINTRASVPVFRHITAFDWDVAPLPAENGRDTNVVFADGYCLTAASANKNAAWQFIEYAASPEGQAILAQSGAVVPAMPSVARSTAFLDPGAKPAHGQVFLDSLPQSNTLPILENWSDIQAIADDELSQAFYGQKDVAQALAAATLRSEEYFKSHSSP